MRTALVTIGDDDTSLETFDSPSAELNRRLLNPDPACRLQVRRLHAQELPRGANRAGATAVLTVRDDDGEIRLAYTVRADRARVRNTRVGVMHAISRLSLVNPGVAANLREIAERQTVWGEPG